MVEISGIFDRLIREIGGTRNFCGSEKNTDDFKDTIILAKACTSYKVDVDEEVDWDNEITCYNCRYRRWTKYGFSCFKDFPAEKPAGGSTK